MDEVCRDKHANKLLNIRIKTTASESRVSNMFEKT
jgi:hypothetical protein